MAVFTISNQNTKVYSWEVKMSIKQWDWHSCKIIAPIFVVILCLK